MIKGMMIWTNMNQKRYLCMRVTFLLIAFAILFVSSVLYCLVDNGKQINPTQNYKIEQKYLLVLIWISIIDILAMTTEIIAIENDSRLGLFFKVFVSIASSFLAYKTYEYQHA